MQKMNKYYFNILGHRTEQDLFVRLVDSVTRQVRISSGYFLDSMYICSTIGYLFRMKIMNISWFLIYKVILLHRYSKWLLEIALQTGFGFPYCIIGKLILGSFLYKLGFDQQQQQKQLLATADFPPWECWLCKCRWMPLRRGNNVT